MPGRYVCCLVLLVIGMVGHSAADEKSKEPKSDPRAVNISLTDGSHLKVQLGEDTVELATPHGKLTFPITDIVKIEFAHRVQEEIALTIDKHIRDLGDADFKVREQAMASLLEKKEKCYATL